MELLIKVKGWYTHYPVPSKASSEVKVSEELEITSGIDVILYSPAPAAMRHRIDIDSMSQIISSISSDVSSASCIIMIMSER